MPFSWLDYLGLMSRLPVAYQLLIPCKYLSFWQTLPLIVHDLNISLSVLYTGRTLCSPINESTKLRQLMALKKR